MRYWSATNAAHDTETSTLPRITKHGAGGSRAKSDRANAILSLALTTPPEEVLGHNQERQTKRNNEANEPNPREGRSFV